MGAFESGGGEYADRIIVDLNFWYSSGPGNPVGAAQGIGYVQELLGRLTNATPATGSSLNSTLDDSTTTFPVDQPM